MRHNLVMLVSCLVCALTLNFTSCKEENTETLYKGTVVNSVDKRPFENLEIKVTDGKNINAVEHTDSKGFFSILVRYNEINSSYYLLIGDTSCVPVKREFKGFGQAEIDLGTIEVEGPKAPTVKTFEPTDITPEGATVGGDVTDDGRTTVTERGICYSTEEYPALESGKHTVNGSGKGEFAGTLTELEHNTTYYVRAYAKNRIGTSYGEQYSFTTGSGEAEVVTDSVYAITAVSAKCAGTVVADGGYKVTARGVCWAKNPDPTTTDYIANEGSGKGEFACAMRNLDINTTYYVRAFATNEVGTVYGEQIKLQTQSGLATITTNSTNSTTASSISIGGKVTDNGGYDVIERGICYSNLISEPTIDEDKISSGKGNGEFTISIKNLTPSTLYYVRAYAINLNGISYGNIEKITTKSGMAVVTLDSITNITALTAQTTAKVIDNLGATLKECGVCWGKTPNPTLSDSSVVGGTQFNTTYSCAMTNLLPNTTYYVRAYATTDVGISYSAQSNFTTKSGLPIVSTAETTANSVQISSGGDVTSDGGYNITARGVCYSTNNSNPTISDNYTTAGIGTGSYTSIITQISLSTTYYIRAYATNQNGTAYGDVITITSGNGLPIVETTIIGENVTETTAISGGNVTDDCGASITARGVCWSTLPYPTVNDNKTSDGGGIGYYSSTITDIDLTSSYTYYVRAYATNENGTSYGRQVLVSKENLDYKHLPTVEYAGYIYRIYNDIGSMAYDAAVEACENLIYGGYDDWELPTKDELEDIMTKIITGWYRLDGSTFLFINKANAIKIKNYDFPENAYYWAQDRYICYYGRDSYADSWGYAMCYHTTKIVSVQKNTYSKYRVRPIRKYKSAE